MAPWSRSRRRAAVEPAPTFYRTWISDRGEFRPRALTAAASVLSGSRVRPKTSHEGRAWQPEVWELYDEIGELHFSAQWIAHAHSQLRVIAAVEDPAGGEPMTVTTGPAAEVAARFAGGPGGMAQLLSRAALHLDMVGETYLIGRTGEGGADMWDAYSADEVSGGHGGAPWKINDGATTTELSDTDTIIRAWIPHPRRRDWPDSGPRSALPVLRELRGLTQMVSAQIDSRLAGAGLLILPQSFTFPTAPGADASDGEDPFMLELIDVATTAIKDRGSAAALVPIVIKAPDDSIGKAQYLRFDTPLDDRAKELRDEAIRRLALALDRPPEVLLGLSQANHWSSWAVTEEALKMAVAPLAGVLFHALTVGAFRPRLDAAGVPEPDRHLLWFDATRLQLRPDRSQDAVAVYDRLELSGAALRRETGFSEDDRPSPDELARVIALQRIRQGQGGPELLAVTVDEPVTPTDEPGAPAPRELPARQPDDTRPLPVRETP